MSAHCLSLSENPVRFEPLRKMTTIFYDDKSNEIFTITHAEENTSIIVESIALRKKSVFTLNHKRHIVSLKFSPDQKFLALQHDKYSVEFIEFKSGVQSFSFTQYSKAHGALLGFVWITGAEVLFITKTSLELYQVEFDKKSLKFLRSISISVTWFLYLPMNNFILLCTGPNGIHLQPYYIADSNFNKLPRLELENSPQFQKHSKPNSILERDVTLTSCYNQTRVLILQHNQNSALPRTDIAVYTISKTVPAKKTHILKLNICGRFALNIVDDLVVVHHQLSKTSFIFDIGSSLREEDNVSVLPPIIEAVSIKPPTDVECELYSPHWVTFQPNIIIDVGIGAFWYLNINLETFVVHIKDKCKLTDFLLQRTLGKIYLIPVLTEAIKSEDRNLENVAQLFNRLNNAYKDKLEMEIQNHVGLPASSSITVQIYKPVTNTKIVLNQSDIYSNVFTKIADSTFKNSEKQNSQYFIWVLLEYIRSLTDYNIPVQHCIYELLINMLVLNKYFHQLHQILQYHVIGDSKPLACLLLSLENIYPPAHQLALDMLHRISNATEEITEVLLSKNQVIAAIRYTDSYGSENELSFRKYLDIAQNVEDSDVFYSVFVEFDYRDRNNGKNVSQLATGGHCDVYIDAFQKRYNR